MAQPVLALVDGQLVEVEVSGGSASVPLLILAGETYAITANSQALFTEPIDLQEGAEISFDANSVLVEVN